MGQAFYAFLAEKERRSGSMRTVQSYSRMLQAFFAEFGKTPDKVSAQDTLQTCLYHYFLCGSYIEASGTAVQSGVHKAPLVGAPYRPRQHLCGERPAVFVVRQG